MRSNVHLWLAALWCGAAVMAFELVGARLLLPVFGMGMDVWAAVIATTLLALAVGYWLGGRIADARPSASVLALAVLLGAACFFVLGSVGRRLVGLFDAMSLASGAWCAALAILALPLVLLGMVPPFLARLLLREAGRAGKVVGGLLAVSTLGGVAGTVLTGLVLIPRVGVSRTLFGLGCGTVAVAVLTFAGARRYRASACAVLIAAAGAVASWRGHAELPAGVLERVEGLYGELVVVEQDGARSLVCNGIVQTRLPASTVGVVEGTLLRGRDYIELIPYFRPEATTALVIGLGGGLHERALALYGIQVHCVELDPAVVRLAAQYFGLGAEVTVADGRRFLSSEPRRFDAIVLDAFLGGVVPEHLYTKEAFGRAAERLAPDGVLAIHLIGRPRHPAVRAVARTLGAVFPHQAAARSGMADELQHLYLFASPEPLELQRRVKLDTYGFTGEELCRIETEGAELLTDDRTCLGLLSRDIVAECRRHSRQRRRSPSW